MAAFYTPSFFIDSVFSSNDPIKNPGFSDEFFPDFDQFYSSSGHQPLNHNDQEGSSLNTISNESSCLEQEQSNTDSFVTEKQSSQSFTSMEEKADKKRKSNHEFSSNSANSKEVKQVKCKKHKGSKEGMKGEDEASEEPPKGYIHVRARRGQATDSHSLAERARREKISQKMKTLQALVPGCDKVTGKALMLDEIINYVQSLQNQVELLSMKLASLDPMVYVFGLMDHDTMSFGAEEMNNSTTMFPTPSIRSTTSHSNTNGYSPPLAFASTSTITNSTTATTTTTTAATSFAGSINLLQHEQKTNGPLQDARNSQYWGLDDLQQQDSIVNQFGFKGINNNNLYSFHE